MKYKLCLAAGAAFLVASCHTTETPTTTTPVVSPHTQKPAQYVALPGQEVYAVDTQAVDAAFEQHAAAYGAPTAAPSPTTSAAGFAAGMQQAVSGTMNQALAPATPVAYMQQPGYTAATPVPTAPQTNYIHQTVQPAMPATGNMHAGPMNYSVKITNCTNGRIFVEAQDAAGTIYPCGFMDKGRSHSTPMENAEPIKGPITVVVRDPDKDGAPEIRRYKVDPPAEYNGKTVGISIVSGGIYFASVNGNVYYAYTPPEAPPTTNPKPVEPAATPDAAANVATTPAAAPAHVAPATAPAAPAAAAAPAPATPAQP